jgi:hypothetical protein
MKGVYYSSVNVYKWYFIGHFLKNESKLKTMLEKSKKKFFVLTVDINLLNGMIYT